MKEKRCSVAVDLNKEKEEADLPSYAQKYRLPDGQEINVGQKRFLCPEGLFQTNLMGEPCEGNRGEPRP